MITLRYIKNTLIFSYFLSFLYFFICFLTFSEVLDYRLKLVLASEQMDWSSIDGCILANLSRFYGQY